MLSARALPNYLRPSSNYDRLTRTSPSPPILVLTASILNYRVSGVVASPEAARLSVARVRAESLQTQEKRPREHIQGDPVCCPEGEWCGLRACDWWIGRGRAKRWFDSLIHPMGG